MAMLPLSFAFWVWLLGRNLRRSRGGGKQNYRVSALIQYNVASRILCGEITPLQPTRRFNTNLARKRVASSCAPAQQTVAQHPINLTKASEMSPSAVGIGPASGPDVSLEVVRSGSPETTPSSSAPSTRNHEECQYLDLIRDILAGGEHRPDRYVAFAPPPSPRY